MFSIKSETWVVFTIGFILGISGYASAQLECELPGNIKGVCVVLNNCPKILEKFKNIYVPLPKETANFLEQIHCGTIDGKIAVCCPKEMRYKRNVENSNEDSISNNPNLGLLPSSACGPITNNKLIGTNRIGLSEMPWMARLQYETSSGLEVKCEGSIINNRYILTAAHCISNLRNNKLHSVILGEHDTETEVDCETFGTHTECNPPKQEFTIEKIIHHENFNQSHFSNDIGLIRLSKPITFDQDHIQPICLPTSNETLNYEFKKLISTGWASDSKRVLNTTPSKVNFEVENLDFCREQFKNYRFTDKQFCANKEGSEGSCGGLGGSSLVHAFNSNGFNYFQLGMFSAGKIRCELGPGIFVNIQKYMDWILNNIEP